MDGIAGPHRLQPAEIVDAGAEQRVWPERAGICGEPHGNRRRVPAGSGEATEN
jgi:hypothetical protein